MDWLVILAVFGGALIGSSIGAILIDRLFSRKKKITEQILPMERGSWGVKVKPTTQASRKFKIIKDWEYRDKK